ncbi:MAG: class I SAM-dependent methyltransferase [Defluviitaleaceae bacterium]|nr:class I SAM-dependent methyltransferase [Defluviitaleaceae bacterium]
MDRYNKFAGLYDRLMEKNPYKAWASFIDKKLREIYPRKIKKMPVVADIACGTGNMSLLLLKKGYDVIGLDISESMLAEAKKKAVKRKKNILFVNQDMRELDLFGTVDAFVCVFDGLNYLPGYNALSETLKRVSLFLNTGGIFIFDVLSEYSYENILAGNFFSQQYKGIEYRWKNHYDSALKQNRCEISFKTKYESFSEVHIQYAFSKEEIINLLSAAGFDRINVFDSYKSKQPGPDCVRLTYTARKK